MSKVNRFEDLIAWQKARKLTNAIYTITRQGLFAKDVGLSGQIQRAAVSIMSNIAEGYERSSRNEFYRYLNIAKASCAELRSQLYVALDTGYLTHIQFGEILAQSEEVGRIIGGLRSSLKPQTTRRTNPQ